MSRIYPAFRSAIATAKNFGNEVFTWIERVVKVLELGEWAYTAMEFARENELLTVVQSFFA